MSSRKQLINYYFYLHPRAYGIQCIDDEYLPNPNYDFIICIIFLVCSSSSYRWKEIKGSLIYFPSILLHNRDIKAILRENNKHTLIQH